MATIYYEFRKANTKNEHLELFELRYETMLESPLKGLLNELDCNLELDEFDLNAEHYGLYENSDGIVTAVGYMRVIQKSVSNVSEIVLEIARERSQKLTNKISQKPNNSFPIQTYFKESKGEIQNEIEKNIGDAWCEASRFILKKEVRSIRLAKFFIDCGFACFPFDHSLISCNSSHARIYKSYGAQSIVENESCFRLPYNCSLLRITPRECSDTLKKKFSKMKSIYLLAGKLCFDISQPNNFLKPIYKKLQSNRLQFVA